MDWIWGYQIILFLFFGFVVHKNIFKIFLKNRHKNKSFLYNSISSITGDLKEVEGRASSHSEKNLRHPTPTGKYSSLFWNRQTHEATMLGHLHLYIVFAGLKPALNLRLITWNYSSTMCWDGGYSYSVGKSSSEALFYCYCSQLVNTLQIMCAMGNLFPYPCFLLGKWNFFHSVFRKGEGGPDLDGPA